MTSTSHLEGPPLEVLMNICDLLVISNTICNNEDEDLFPFNWFNDELKSNCLVNLMSTCKTLHQKIGGSIVWQNIRLTSSHASHGSERHTNAQVLCGTGRMETFTRINLPKDTSEDYEEDELKDIELMEKDLLSTIF